MDPQKLIVNHTPWFKPELGAAWQPTRTGCYEVAYSMSNGTPPKLPAGGPGGIPLLHYDVVTGRWSVWRPRSKKNHMIEAHIPLAWRGLTGPEPEYRKVIQRVQLIEDDQQQLPLPASRVQLKEQE